jgi:LacI family transcriptional regulator
MYQIMLQYPDVTAVFLASDLMVLGALWAMEQLGKKIPE